MNTKEASQDKVEKPHANFETPHEIIADPAVSKQEKVRCSPSWNRTPIFWRRQRLRA
jgi:hypothetical protein